MQTNIMLRKEFKLRGSRALPLLPGGLRWQLGSRWGHRSPTLSARPEELGARRLSVAPAGPQGLWTEVSKFASQDHPHPTLAPAQCA